MVSQLLQIAFCLVWQPIQTMQAIVKFLRIKAFAIISTYIHDIQDFKRCQLNQKKNNLILLLLLLLSFTPSKNTKIQVTCTDADGSFELHSCFSQYFAQIQTKYAPVYINVVTPACGLISDGYEWIKALKKNKDRH